MIGTLGLVLVLLLLAGGMSIAGERVHLPGTGIELIAPPGMEPSREFQGFADPVKGIALLVAELPVKRGEVPEFLSAMTDGALAAQGLTRIARTVLADGVAGNLLITGEQVALGIPFERWIYIAPGERALAMITVQMPQQFAGDAIRGELRASLASVRIASDATAGAPDADEIEALPFAFAVGGRFELRSVIAGNTVLLHAAEAPDRTQAILLISKSLALGSQDRLEISVQALESLEGVETIAIDEEFDEVTVGELMGIELTARCTEKSSRAPCFAYQLMLFDTDAGYRVLGITHSDLAAAYLPEFMRIARSLMPR